MISANISKYSPGRTGTCLHEVLARTPGKTGAHEHVEYIVNLGFSLMQRLARSFRKSTREIGMAAVVILPVVAQKIVGVGIAARTNHIVHRVTKFIETIPVETVMGNGGHRP